MATVIDVRQAEDPRDIVHRAAQAVAEGQTIGLPTDTVYVLAASALSVKATSELVQLKQPAQQSPGELPTEVDEYSVAIAVKSADEALDYMCYDSPLAIRFARRCWPGPVTLVVPYDKTRSAVSRLPQSVQRMVTDHAGRVGLCVVAHPLLEHLQKYCAGPIALSSANRDGQPPATTGVSVAETFGDSLPLILDDGATKHGGPPTVIGVNGNQFKIVREGVVETAAIRQYARPTIVMVCTGNTCRSPMAEALMRKRLADHFESAPEGAIGPEVSSVGLAALPGDPANPQAVETMRQHGLDLAQHESQPFGEQVLRSADLVLTMTRSHRNAIISRWPEAEDRVFTLRRDGGDVSDPIGSPLETYKACAEQIDRELAAWVESLGPHWLAVPESDSQGEE